MIDAYSEKGREGYGSEEDGGGDGADGADSRVLRWNLGINQKALERALEALERPLMVTNRDLDIEFTGGSGAEGGDGDFSFDPSAAAYHIANAAREIDGELLAVEEGQRIPDRLWYAVVNPEVDS